MTKRQKQILHWALAALLILVVILIQTVVLAIVRPFGLQLYLLPVAVACLAMRERTEQSALFGLCVGLFWCLYGAEAGSLGIVTLTLTAALCAGACDAFLTRNLGTALLLSIVALFLVEGAVFLAHLYLGAVAPDLFLTTFLPAAGLSLIAWPPCYFLTGCIAKLGG